MNPNDKYAYCWLDKLTNDAKRDLALDDSSLAFALLMRGVKYLQISANVKVNNDFECWLEHTIRDIKRKLKLNDKELTDVLLSRGTYYFLRTLANDYLERNQQ